MVRLGSFRASRAHRTGSVAAKFSDIDAYSTKAWHQPVLTQHGLPRFLVRQSLLPQLYRRRVDLLPTRLRPRLRLAGVLRTWDSQKEKNGFADKF